MSLLRKFNSRVPWPVRLVLVGAIGLSIVEAAGRFVPSGFAFALKVSGNAPLCSWARVLSFQSDLAGREKLDKGLLAELSVKESDQANGIQLISTSKKPYWIKAKGEKLDGKELLADLLADHDLLAQWYPQYCVRPGDIVLDCGAHVGVFTQKALDLGASKVISIEPDPVNMECLRRNHSRAIAEGRVIPVQKGVWSSEGSMTLRLALENSGMNTVVPEIQRSSDGSVTVPVTRIDTIVKSLGLPRVDYIKMDIEGAEREALAGAMETLRHSRPRMMVDSYHRSDDPQVLPAVIRKAHADYQMICGPCQLNPTPSLIPHVAFYQ